MGWLVTGSEKGYAGKWSRWWLWLEGCGCSLGWGHQPGPASCPCWARGSPAGGTAQPGVSPAWGEPSLGAEPSLGLA